MAPTYFPLIAQYLWMKIDFVAMAQTVDDPEALAAAEKLAQEGKTYLVFNAASPFGFDQTSEYAVDIVTRGPRLVDTAEGFSRDMFVPVYPFTHPEHQSVRPKPDLPFPDCSHWLGSMVDVAVQMVSEGLDNSKAYELPFIQAEFISSIHDKQWDRLAAQFLTDSEGVANSSPSVPTPAPCGPSPSPTLDSSAPDAVHSGEPQISDDDSCMDGFLPLVNVGVDINHQFSESGQLPSVYDFFEVRQKLKRVLSTARDRLAALERHAIVSSSSTKQPSDSPG
ncbi:hypothetical protein V8D89_003370 [Ganoderma adspersum]